MRGDVPGVDRHSPEWAIPEFGYTLQLSLVHGSAIDFATQICGVRLIFFYNHGLSVY